MSLVRCFVDFENVVLNYIIYQIELFYKFLPLCSSIFISFLGQWLSLQRLVVAFDAKPKLAFFGRIKNLMSPFGYKIKVRSGFFLGWELYIIHHTFSNLEIQYLWPRLLFSHSSSKTGTFFCLSSFLPIHVILVFQKRDFGERLYKIFTKKYCSGFCIALEK